MKIPDDPFTPVWRTHRKTTSRAPSTYHLTPNCPKVQAGVRLNKGRLGAALISGRVLCSYEAGKPANRGGGPRATPDPLWNRLQRLAKEAST